MKVALCSQAYPPGAALGGIATQTRTKAHGLAALGHEVTVIAQSADGRRSESDDDAVRVVRIPGYDPRLPELAEPARWIVYSAEVAAAVAELDEAEGLDVVDFAEWGCEGYVHLLNRTPWRHVPTVVQLHGPLVMLARTIGWPEPDSELYRVGRHMEKTCVRLADRLYSSSDLSAEWAAREYGLERDAIETLHLGVDTDVFRPGLRPRHERPTIVFAGRIARSKGVEVLVDAALALVQEFPRLRVRFIGHDPDGLGSELVRRAAASGAPGLVELVGFLDAPALARELSESHVFAAPSFYEGGPGLVYLEAMACGVPVVAASGSGVDEVVRHGENGFLVPPGNSVELAAALGDLLRNAADREAMGQRAREIVEAEADSRMCAHRLEGVYEAVAAVGAAS